MSSLQTAISAASHLLCLSVTTIGLFAAEIHDAAAAGDLNKVRSLLAADPTLLESKDKRGMTPLGVACFGGPPTFNEQPAVADFLIDKGANVNAKENSGYTPLHRVMYSRGQNLALIRRLIEKGADINAPGSNGRTPLNSAAQSGNLDLAKFLLTQGADVNAGNDYRGPINTGDIAGTTTQVAIKYSPNEAMAKLLVENGAVIGQRDSFGNTELLLAAMRGYVDLVQLLIEKGADVNAANESGHTALYYAAKHGFRRTSEALIAAGAQQSETLETNYGKAPQLAATLKDGEAYLWYLGGGSYAVKTKNHLLMFNPPESNESTEAGLANGQLNVNELAGLQITSLLTWAWSESSPEMLGFFELARRMPGVALVSALRPAAASPGAGSLPLYHFAVAHESFSLGGIQVHSIPAMAGGRGGGGLGYLVEADGMKIFHAGFHASPSNAAEQVEKYRREIDFLRPFGPIDIAILPVKSHIDVAYEPYLYLLDQLSPKAVYLSGANQPDEHPKCAAVLRAHGIPVSYPEKGGGRGERFHFVRDQTPTAAVTNNDERSASSDYLGQPLPGATPEVFARGSVSTDDLEHSAPAFSPDGNEVYWRVNRRPGPTNKEWLAFNRTMRFEHGRWSEPHRGPFDSQLVFSVDGRRAFFSTPPPNSAAALAGQPIVDVWCSDRKGEGWSEPRCLNLVARYPELRSARVATVARNGALYMEAYAPGTFNDAGIYRAELVNGEYAKPELLPRSINLPPFLNWTPFIAPDESFLLFSSNRTGSLDKYGDIFISRRQPDGSWSDPVSLGEPVNSNRQERFPMLSPNGKYLFFTRPTPGHDQDVYWVETASIPALRATTKCPPEYIK